MDGTGLRPRLRDLLSVTLAPCDEQIQREKLNEGL